MPRNPPDSGRFYPILSDSGRFWPQTPPPLPHFATRPQSFPLGQSPQHPTVPTSQGKTSVPVGQMASIPVGRRACRALSATGSPKRSQDAAEGIRVAKCRPRSSLAPTSRHLLPASDSPRQPPSTHWPPPPAPASTKSWRKKNWGGANFGPSLMWPLVDDGRGGWNRGKPAACGWQCAWVMDSLPPLASHFAGGKGRLMRWQPGRGQRRKSAHAGGIYSQFYSRLAIPTGNESN
jgi:hypothetical protein